MTKKVTGYGKSIFPLVRKRLGTKKLKRLKKKKAKRLTFLGQKPISLYPFKK